MALDLDARALTHSSSTSRLGLLGKRSRLLRLQGDERLIEMMREGHVRAFEALVDRYQARLLAFCRGMLASAEDAEDVLQEVFVAAHKAILADNRTINARPWLYRIARNRCLNHLRKPVPEGQDSMDVLPHENGTSTAEKVEKRAEFRALLGDVQELPETQRTALLLREIDALSYEEIAVAMETTVPAVKSLLVRARISLADCSQGRQLTCDEVHLELAEAVEGLRKASGPARAHMKGCERCRRYRKELRRNGKALASMAPIGLVAGLHHGLLAKLGLGGAGSAGSAGGSAVGAGAGGGGALGIAGSSAAGLGSAVVGAKAVAGVAASVALLTAGAVEVNRIAAGDGGSKTAPIEQSGATAMVVDEDTQSMHGGGHAGQAAPVAAKEEGTGRDDEGTSAQDQGGEDPATETETPTEPTAPVEETPVTPPVDEAGTGDASGGSGTGNADTTNPGDSDGVITPPTEPPADPATPPETAQPVDGGKSPPDSSSSSAG